MITLAVSLSAAVSAQSDLQVWSGANVADHFGRALATAADFDGDGVRDVVVGAPEDDGAGADAGAVRVFSGATGNQLLVVHGPLPLAGFGAAVANAGDVDLDGVPDLVVGSASGQGAWVFSGTGALIHPLGPALAGDRFGYAVAGVGDVNGDAVPDVAIGAPQNAPGGLGTGYVVVYSGANASVLNVYCGLGGGDVFGAAVACVSDLDGDGHAEIAVGATEAPSVFPPQFGAGYVHVYSGMTGALLLALSGTAAADRFGAAVADAGDVDGDATADLIVGTRSGGYAAVFSGADGTELHHLVGVSGDDFGRAVAGIGDVDLDGHADVLVGAPLDDAAFPNAGAAWVISGADGSRIAKLRGRRTNEAAGSAVAGVGDADGDGFVDLVVAAPYSDGAGLDAGEVRLVTLAPQLGPFAVGHVAGPGGGPPQPILTVNASSGGALRRVRLAPNASLALAISQPTGVASPVPFILYGRIGVPALAESIELIPGQASLCFVPCSLLPSNPLLFTLANNVGADVCPQVLPSWPTPWSIQIPLSSAPGTVTLQALILHPTLGPTSTNGVIAQLL